MDTTRYSIQTVSIVAVFQLENCDNFLAKPLCRVRILITTNFILKECSYYMAKVLGTTPLEDLIFLGISDPRTLLAVF